jgi:hypothetical protein
LQNALRQHLSIDPVASFDQLHWTLRAQEQSELPAPAEEKSKAGEKKKK